MKHWKTVLSLALATTSSSSLTACSKNSQFLKSMDLSVTEKNNTSFVNLSAEVDLGNISIDGLQIPILDPHTQTEVGSVSLSAATSGKELVTLSLDAASLLHGDASLGATLPNGRALPSSIGAQTGSVFAIPILNYSRVYIGGDLKSSIVVGVALAVQALDNVTGSVGLNSNIFFSQAFNSSLTGVAGIYASGTAHQNGIAVFGRYTAPAASSVPASTPIPEVVTADSGLNTTAPIQIKRVSSFATESASVTTISVSGKTPLQTGNTVLNDGMSNQGEQRLYQYFYGKKRTVHAH